MGEAKQRRAAGLGFKSESRVVQNIKRAIIKANEDEKAFEESTCLTEDELKEIDEEQDGDEIGWNDETQSYEKC